MTGHAEVGCEGRLGEVARHTERALHTLQYRKNIILKIKTHSPLTYSDYIVILEVEVRLPLHRSQLF